MNNDYTNPSTMSNNTWSSAGQSTNPSQTNSNNNQSQPTSSATSTFNNYTLNTKWGSHNSSQSSTPTNPSTLTATFPSLSSGIPPLYPSISAQSSNSINQGGAPSPFAHHTGTGIPPHQNIANTPTNQTSAYAFNAAQQTLNAKIAGNNNTNNQNNTNQNTTNNSSNPSLNATNTNSNNPSNNNSRPSTAGGHGGGISQSSSSSSLTGLSGGISKLQINTNALGSYNPYSTGSGFTPYAGGHTPTGNNSAANTPNPGNGATPTGFRFSGYPNPYSQIATPPTPANGLLGGAMGGPGGPFAQARFNSNTLHQQAIQNNINAMGLNYRIGKLPTLSANNSLTGLPNLSNPPSMNNPGLTQQTSNNTNTNSNGLPTPANNNSNDKKMNLNSNAAPYQPRTNANAPPTTLINPLGTNTDNMKNQQLAHQQKAENVPYSYPSYAEAVNKVNTLNIANINNQLQAQLQQAQMQQQQQQKQKILQSNDKENDNDSNTENTKLASESEEAIQKLNPISWPSNPKHAKFYVIKSFGEDDVHKSIKYNLWCSTERGNRKLDEAFNESKRINAANNNQPLDDNIGKASGQQRKGKNKKDKDKSDQNLVDPRDTVKGCPVYLFFSVNRSGCFCGMAQMISNYYKDRHFGSWVQDGKWQGSFIVKWIYVKDIPNKDLKDIQLPNNDNRPVTFSRDTQEIPFNQGIEMLRRFIKYEPKTNILQDFKYYDDRERDIKQKRTQQMIMQQLQQQQMGGMSNLGGMQNNPFSNNNNQNQGNNNNRSSNNMNSYNNNKFGNNNNIQDVRNGPYKRGRYNSGYNNNNNENYNNNYGGNNNSQIEGYNNSHRGGRGGYKGYNSRRYNNGYNNNRRYQSKHDRNNSYHNSGYRGGGRGGYRSNNNYGRNNNNNNNNNNDNNYGNIQILSRKNNHKSTPGNSDRNSNNGLDDMDDNNQQNSPARGSRNRNRNRWVPK